jgi:hypothetical protein
MDDYSGPKKVHISMRLLRLDPLPGERRNRSAFTLPAS